jgi:hypothetical protein
MVHPAEAGEFEFLTGEEFGHWLRNVELGDFRRLAEARDGTSSALSRTQPTRQ